MRVLGICHDVLICSAALVENGEVRFAVAEERVDRIKQSRVFPQRAIAECFRATGTSWDDIDEVAVGWNPGVEAETTPLSFVAHRRWRTEHFQQIPVRLLQMSGRPAASLISHEQLWNGGPKVTFVDHYMAHVGNAAFLSPFDDCAIAVLDGRGERSTALLGTVRDAKVDVLEEVVFPHSLGLLYGTVTQFLGFQPDSDEWKVMALASYASPDSEFLEPMRRLIRVDDDGRFTVALEYFEFFNFWHNRMYSDRFLSLFGAPRARDEEFTDRHRSIAGALQIVFEQAVAKILTALSRRTKMKHLVASGGCFMNSVFNGKITQLTPFEECFISSCPDDSGTSIGAALYVWSQRTGRRPPHAAPHNYWGPEYSDEECLAVARRCRLHAAEVLADPSQQAARDLASGKLVGWVQGRSEFGQRALGNRSILADPRRADAKDLVNAAVKYRESFRPFAPAILSERVAEYFECEPACRVPFMEKVLPFRADKREQVPAVVHVDGSGRLQTVDEHTSPRFHRLIRCFEQETGVPIVLNTSFNLNGEPIVNSPEDAIRTFYSCGLDVLYLGNVRIAK